MSDASARWWRVDALCQAALDVPETERKAFLLESCEDDDVRREVATLLAQASAAERFLESPVGAAAASALAEDGTRWQERGSASMRSEPSSVPAEWGMSTVPAIRVSIARLRSRSCR